MISAKIIKDSICECTGNRLTTFELEFPQIILPQVLTHRVFSRSTSSNRAIPVRKSLEKTLANPYVPATFRLNQRGMVAGAPLDEQGQELAHKAWLTCLKAVSDCVQDLMSLNVAKEQVNRLLSPFSFVRMILSGTEFENFFDLRLAHDAQPEIQELARCMKEEMVASIPQTLSLGQWHIPYADHVPSRYTLLDKILISAGRCARVSYLTHEGELEPNKDLLLAHRLIKDRHLSPLEHPARCMQTRDKSYANFSGWASLRYLQETEMLHHYVPWDSWLTPAL